LFGIKPKRKESIEKGPVSRALLLASTDSTLTQTLNISVRGVLHPSVHHFIQLAIQKMKINVTLYARLYEWWNNKKVRMWEWMREKYRVLWETQKLLPRQREVLSVQSSENREAVQKFSLNVFKINERIRERDNVIVWSYVSNFSH
jgi:hypothetical protein